MTVEPAPTTTREPDDRIAMVLSLVPGLGQVYLDHTVLGAVFFASCVTSLNMLFLGTQLQSLAHTDVLWWVGLVSLITVWCGGIWHTYLQSYGTDRLRLAQSREVLLRAALIDYLRDELEASVEKLEQAIELDVDWQDPDPYFHLGVVSLRLAERHAQVKDNEAARAARRRSQWAFKTCLSRDLNNKWRAEIGRESKRMRKLLSVTGRLRGLTASGRMQILGSDSGSFPELRESNTWRRPGSMTMEKLREAKEGGRDSGVLSELSAELEEVRRAPRTRRTSRKMSKQELEQRLSMEHPEPMLGGPKDETVDLTALDKSDETSDRDAAEMLGGDDETITLPAPERNESDTQSFSKAKIEAEALGATDEPIPAAIPSPEGGMPPTRNYPGVDPDLPPTLNSGLKRKLAEAESEEYAGKATKPILGAKQALEEVEATDEPEVEGGLPATRKASRDEILAAGNGLTLEQAVEEPRTERGPPDTRKEDQAALLARAEELAAGEAAKEETGTEGGPPATRKANRADLKAYTAALAAAKAEGGPPETRKENTAKLLARAEELAEKVSAGQVEGGMPTTRAPEPKNLDALAAQLAAAAEQTDAEERTAPDAEPASDAESALDTEPASDAGEGAEVEVPSKEPV